MVTNILYCNSDGSCARLGMYKRLYKRLLMQAAAAQCLTSCMPDPPCRLVFDITHKWMAGDRDGVAAKGRWRPLRVSTDALTLDTPPTQHPMRPTQCRFHHVEGRGSLKLLFASFCLIHCTVGRPHPHVVTWLRLWHTHTDCAAGSSADQRLYLSSTKTTAAPADFAQGCVQRDQQRRTAAAACCCWQSRRG
jgi:hypothetical protein